MLRSEKSQIEQRILSLQDKLNYQIYPLDHIILKSKDSNGDTKDVLKRLKANTVGGYNRDSFQCVLFGCVQKADRMVKYVLENAFPTQVGKLKINSYFYAIDRSLLFRYYSYSVIKVIPKVTETITLHKFIINKQDFQRIMSNCQHLQEIEFSCCTIDSIDAKFRSRSDCRLNTINFYGCDKEKFSDWFKTPSKFFSILEALAATTICNSLTHLGAPLELIFTTPVSTIKRKYNLNFLPLERKFHF
ncbi:unnamed protein product [Moneuplotes crassus]|uniref:Uncharacterized protein n=1 Tax=Euplotes crassus TaxID=5936 RepID=A0AAD1XUQ0_EUPCR|nr:unnamed protein product [Moneuplotes crassus]